MKVRWDNGEETLCRVGADGKYNLYVLEPAAARIEPVVNRDEQVVADRPQHPPVLQLGARAAPILRMRATDPLQVCFRFPSSIMKTIKEETWMGRKRYGKTAGYLVQVDVGLIRQQKLRPEEADLRRLPLRSSTSSTEQQRTIGEDTAAPKVLQHLWPCRSGRLPSGHGSFQDVASILDPSELLHGVGVRRDRGGGER